MDMLNMPIDCQVQVTTRHSMTILLSQNTTKTLSRHEFIETGDRQK